MKSLFAIAALSFSVSAIAACPDLSGAWKCTMGSHTSDLTIAQHDITNGVHYDLTHSCHPTMGLDADGTPHTTTNDKGTLTVLGECQDDGSLHVNVNAVSADQKKSYVEDINVALTDADTMTTKGTIKETHGDQTHEKTIDTTCTRAPAQ